MGKKMRDFFTVECWADIRKNIAVLRLPGYARKSGVKIKKRGDHGREILIR